MINYKMPYLFFRAPENADLRYFIGATFDVQSMKLVWDDRSDSVVRNWCSGQPTIDNRGNLDPIPDQCVMAISSGCWILSTCDKVGFRQRNYICDFGQNCPQDDLRNIRSMVGVLRKDSNGIRTACKSCQ